MLPREQSDLGSYYLQYRLPKNMGRQEEQTTKVMTGRLHVHVIVSEYLGQLFSYLEVSC